MKKLFGTFFRLTTILGRLLLLYVGIATIVQLLALTRLGPFVRLDGFFSKATLELVPFLPFEEGIGLFSSWSTFGKYALAIAPYLIVVILVRTLIDVGEDKGIPRAYGVTVRKVFLDTIPNVASAVLAMQAILVLAGVLGHDIWGWWKYVNLFLMGVVIIGGETKADLPSEDMEISDQDVKDMEKHESKKLVESMLLEIKENENYPELEKACVDHLARFGDDSVVVIGQAVAVLGQGRFHESRSILVKCLESDPEGEDAEAAEALIHVIDQTISAIEAKQEEDMEA